MKEVSFKNFLIHAFTLRLRGVKNIIIHTGFRTLQVANRFEPAIWYVFIPNGVYNLYQIVVFL